jgi:PAS domain S-box-containing protein
MHGHQVKKVTAMTPYNTPVINIGLVGGGKLCEELLEKTTFAYNQEEVNTPILAVADPDAQSPGMLTAKRLGLLTFKDYHPLYDERYNIHLIIILDPCSQLLDDILATRPPRIRILSYDVFDIFWKTICQQERTLLEQNEAMQTILNGIQDLISVISPEMEIVEVNDAFLQQMGYTREEVIGKKCYEVFQNRAARCNQPSIACPLDEVIRNQRRSQQIMTRISQNGDPIYFEVSAYPIWEKDGKISKFIEISRDITQRLEEEAEITRRLEEMVEERTHQLKETHAKLLHQDKMASLGKLAATVVHEINNPIAGILNLTLLIQRIIAEGSLQKNDIDQFEQYLNLMETETRRISRIVTNLLAFSRQKTMKVGPIDINRLLENTLILNANLLKIHNIKLDRQLADDLPALTGSEDQLQQVFMNFISNAAESMEARGEGRLAIKTGSQKQKPGITITIQDTGVGIPSAHMNKLFDPFFTTKKQGQGVGLGLSVAYGIIKEHGGLIKVRSKVGQGSAFVIELPLTKSNI